MKVAGSTTQFLYSSWLDWQYTITSENELGEYVVNQSIYARNVPFLDQGTKTLLPKGAKVIVTGMAKNKYNSTFYRAKYNGKTVWIWVNYLNKYYSQPTITVTTHINGPSTIKYGTGYGLRGVVSTNYGKITKVTAQIINTRTNAVKISFVATPNATTFNINGSSASDKGTKNGGTAKINVNNAITFGSLPRGTYRYVLTFTAVNGNKTTMRTIPVITFTVK